MASELEKQKKADITESTKKDGKVDLTTLVKITGNGKGPLEDGKEYDVHPILKEKLVKKGFGK